MNQFKFSIMLPAIALLVAGCGGIQIIPMDIENQTYPRQLTVPRPHDEPDKFESQLLLDRIIEEMVSDLAQENPDIATITLRDFQVVNGKLSRGIIERKLAKALVESNVVVVAPREKIFQNPMIGEDARAGYLDVYGFGAIHYGESTHGYIDGYIVNKGRLYTLNLKLIQASRNNVIWSKTIKWPELK